jgi:hypothetical protein
MGFKFPPMYEFLAKNVGIRRASGRYIMGHALDTIITEKWWEDVALNGLLEIAEKGLNVSKPAPFVLHRMIRADSLVRLNGTEECAQVESALAMRVGELMSCGGRNVMKKEPLSASRLASVVTAAEECVRTGSGLFTEASGDFELMTREAWWHLRAFPERNTYAHFDSVLLYAARAMGFRVHGHFRSISDPSRFFLIWHQGHSEGGFLARTNAYDAIVTPFWKYHLDPLWGFDDRKEWGMPRHRFDEVVWLRGVKQ